MFHQLVTRLSFKPLDVPTEYRTISRPDCVVALSGWAPRRPTSDTRASCAAEVLLKVRKVGGLARIRRMGEKEGMMTAEVLRRLEEWLGGKNSGKSLFYGVGLRIGKRYR